MTGLVNLMEETVLEKIDQLWKQTNYCKCEKCRMDIAAYALNRLPPRYVQSFEGKMLHQFEARTTQTDAEITAVVYQGIKVVGDEPHKNTNEY